MHRQHVSHALQVGDPLFDIGQMVERQRFDFGAGIIAAIGQIEQGTHLIEGEPQFAPAANEGEPFDVAVGLNTMTAGRARRLRRNADALVIADGFNIDAGGL